MVEQEPFTREVVLKVAVMVVSAVIETVHEPVPEHPPTDQPVKVEPEDGEAVRVMEVPEEILD